jgi:hypothetical protein
VITAVASDEPEPLRFVVPPSQISFVTYSPADYHSTASGFASILSWLRGDRDPTVPLSTINLEGRMA